MLNFKEWEVILIGLIIAASAVLGLYGFQRFRKEAEYAVSTKSWLFWNSCAAMLPLLSFIGVVLVVSGLGIAYGYNLGYRDSRVISLGEVRLYKSYPVGHFPKAQVTSYGTYPTIRLDENQGFQLSGIDRVSADEVVQLAKSEPVIFFIGEGCFSEEETEGGFCPYPIKGHLISVIRLIDGTTLWSSSAK